MLYLRLVTLLNGVTNIIIYFHIYLELCKKSSCFLDIGAHIGLVSLPASTIIKKGGVVYSFEPSSRNLFLSKISY